MFELGIGVGIGVGLEKRFCHVYAMGADASVRVRRV